jgi:DNA-binding response OmpR family regulator
MAEKILVVDDEVDTLRLVGLTLQRQGYQIIAAGSGSQALEMVQSESPDLVILDVMMPDLDGYEVARQVRASENNTHLPIIMFSAKTQSADKEVGMESGADAYLTKPIHPTELANHVKLLLEQSRERVRAAQPGGYVIGVIGAKGGIGVSTLVLNLAISLQQITGKSVVAAEFNPGHGAWKLETDQRGLDGLSNLLRMSPKKLTPQVIERELFRTTYGPRLLFSSRNFQDISLLKATVQVESISHQLQKIAPLTILDFGTMFWPNYDKLVLNCDEIILVSEPMTDTLMRTKQIARELEKFDFGAAKPLRAVVVNRAPYETSLSLKQAQAILKTPIAVMVPPVPEAASQAEEMKVPLIMLQPDGLAALHYHKLGQKIKEYLSDRV